ncbi:MAG: hypothetical protein HC817_04720 [Saprospiraceae bacterium]|nr:hypothetical protein [Saprospiraceae bacterium]
MIFGGIFWLLFALFTTPLQSCKTKEGCSASQKKYINNMDKTTKRGNSNLFSKDMRKKMKKN